MVSYNHLFPLDKGKASLLPIPTTLPQGKKPSGAEGTIIFIGVDVAISNEPGAQCLDL